MYILVFILSSITVQGPAVIGNGNVLLGIQDFGQLNAPYAGNVLGLPATDPRRLNRVGLREGNGQFESTAQGFQAEGWGVGVPNLGTSVYANNFRGSSAVLISFIGTDGDDSATSVVRDVTGQIQVTHEYFPSPDSIYAYEVTVTIDNISPNNFDRTIYRRVMDWDIDPTIFREYVTHIGTNAADLIFSSDDGFCPGNPLSTNPCNERAPGTTNVDFEDSGPRDHGSVFTFDFGLYYIYTIQCIVHIQIICYINIEHLKIRFIGTR